MPISRGVHIIRYVSWKIMRKVAHFVIGLITSILIYQCEIVITPHIHPIAFQTVFLFTDNAIHYPILWFYHLSNFAVSFVVAAIVFLLMHIKFREIRGSFMFYYLFGYSTGVLILLSWLNMHFGITSIIQLSSVFVVTSLLVVLVKLKHNKKLNKD